MRSHTWLSVLAPLLDQRLAYTTNTQFVADIVTQASPLTNLRADITCVDLYRRCQSRGAPVMEAQRGDLLFWGSCNRPYYVAIYYGGGYYVHWNATTQEIVITTLTKQNYPSFSVFVPEK